MPPRTRAGSREARFRPGYGRITNRRISWLRTLITNQLAISVYSPEEYDEENEIEISSEPGKSYILSIPVPGRKRGLVWNLSNMTTQELEATRQFFNYLFDLADPVVRERDKVAQDAYAKGDDSYTRVFRAVPQFIIRERQVGKDGKGLRERLESAAVRVGDGLNPDGGVRGSGDELVDGEPESGSSQDDGPTPDKS